MINCFYHCLSFVCDYFYAYSLTLVISLNMLLISRFGFVFSFFTGFLVISTFSSVSLILPHKDWLLLSISYHVVFHITWYFCWNFRGSFRASSKVIDSFPISYTFYIANISKKLLLRPLPSSERFCLYQKHWNLKNFDICLFSRNQIPVKWLNVVGQGAVNLIFGKLNSLKAILFQKPWQLVSISIPM